jgi:hypothetical protein
MVEYIVYIWLSIPYNGHHIEVGRYTDCETGVKQAQELYPNYTAYHCILPKYLPPGS